MRKWVSRLVIAAGLLMLVAGILTYTYYDVNEFIDRWTQFATYPYRQYSASLLFGGFALSGIGFALLLYAHAEAETALSRQTKIALFFSIVFMVPLFVWIGSFIRFYAGPTRVTDEESLQTFFTSIVLLPVLFIAGLVVLDRLAHRLADKKEKRKLVELRIFSYSPPMNSGALPFRKLVWKACCVSCLGSSIRSDKLWIRNASFRDEPGFCHPWKKRMRTQRA
jgi:hypothetical protein